VAGELRITGGALARRRIKVPPAADQGTVRPTSDKVRAAVMSALGNVVDGARVLDLFAGSGALGFEALSRGASLCTFVERDRKTMRVVEENAAALGVEDRCIFELGDAGRGLSSIGDGEIDVAFVDPPYAHDVGPLWPALLRVLAPRGVVVLERDKRSKDDVPAATALDVVRDRVYGDTRVVTLERREEQPMTAAIYPGSFDPLTNGHVDIIHRGIASFEKIIVAVANNPQKSPLFTVPERIALVKECLGDVKGVEVDTFDGLIIEYAQKKGVHVLLRGLRAVSDFEYEFQLASMNRKLAKNVETVFMMTSEESFYLSSRLVREVASFGGDVSEMVPGPVYEALRKKFARRTK
jgi:pantetheine-phosphate adenylyltransferase